MLSLNVELQNCYGIKSLKSVFEFEDNSKTYVLYAPNGVMKTSFAKTVSDYITGKNESRDGVFEREPYLRQLKDEGGIDFPKDNLFVINSYVDTKYASDNISTLLVRADLREKYDEALSGLTEVKKPIVKELSLRTQSSDCEKEVIRTFSYLGDNFFDVVDKLLPELIKNKDSYTLYDFRYNNIFDNSSVEGFVKKHRASIKLYHDMYFEILGKSDGFFAEDGSFGTVQASSVSKSVSDDTFFKAGHKFILKNQASPIESSADFKAEIEKAKKKVLSDPELKKQFDKIDSALAPSTLSPLREIVKDRRDVLLQLLDYDKFREEYWKGHLAAQIEELQSLSDRYATDKKIIDGIIAEANNESDLWKETLRIFKSRFFNLPFEVDIKDKKDAMLGLKKPELVYRFVDRDTGESKEKDTEFLTEKVLSTGEKRAFYLLNIIFEIQSRLASNHTTVFVIDDIADSFDYKNKYAIVEYLHDLSASSDFYSLILTHNFDFYRTVTLRLKVKSDKRLFAQKEVDRIALVEEAAACPMDPFKLWKSSMNEVQLLALIPFVRNLIEYGDYDPRGFLGLTALLHVKSELKYKPLGVLYKTSELSDYDETTGDFTILATGNITYDHIEAEYKKYLGIKKFPDELNSSVSVAERLLVVAESIDDTSSLLENKIVLAMAIRHIAEAYMIKMIGNMNWINRITGSQTSTLVKKFRNKVENGDIAREDIHAQAVELLERVNIATPENIHINSFMYEPLIDMGITELKRLHDDIKAVLV